MAIPRMVLAAVMAASLCSGPIVARSSDGQTAAQSDRVLATALTARDTAQAVRLATEALSAPLALPDGHAAAAILGAGLRSQLPTLLANTPPGPVSSAHLNNLGVALALRGWNESAAVAFSGSLLVEEARTAGRPWGSALDPFAKSSSIQRYQVLEQHAEPRGRQHREPVASAEDGSGPECVRRSWPVRVLQRAAGVLRTPGHAGPAAAGDG